MNNYQEYPPPPSPGVVSGVISSTEAELEESERFHFLPTPLISENQP